jgi:branched-chain amino acid transport system ATP-binding protein
MSDILTIEQCDVNFGYVRILRGMSLSVPAGDTVALVGRNGAGKTTTLRTAMGLVPPKAGQITFDGVDITRLSADRRPRMGIGYMPEDRRLVPGLSVRDNILLPAMVNDVKDYEERLTLIFEVIPELKEFLLRPALALSGGQQKMVALARAMITGSRLLILDEPLEGLAPAWSQRVTAAVRLLQAEQGVAMLVAESQNELAALFTSDLVHIERGEVVQAEAVAEKGEAASPS